MDISQTSPGNLLRTTREKKGLTIEDVAKHLHLTTRQVKALEENDHSLWPSLTYVPGYLRNYAHLLGIDDKEVLQIEPTIAVAPEREATLETHNLWLPFEPRKRKNFFLALLFVAFLGIVFFIAIPWIAKLLPKQENSKTTVQNSGPQSSLAVAPNVQPPIQQSPQHDAHEIPDDAELPLILFPEGGDVQEPTAALRNQLIINAKTTCWIGVYDQAGKLMLSKTLHAGETLQTTAGKPFTIKIGRPDAVSITYEGNSVDLSGYRPGRTASVVIGN
jgi:cytoskeleton protein RodZ